MGKTRKKIQEEIIRKAYFAYWKLQNNQKYVDAYPKGLSRSDRENFNLPNLLFRSPGEEPILLPCVDPSKKIDWANMISSPDFEIVNLHPGFTPAQQVSGYKLMEKIIEKKGAFNLDEFKGPIVTFHVDLRFDNKEILHVISRIINNLRSNAKIKPCRDPISKFHLYAQIWDLRKGFPKKSFREIARELRRPIQTVISQYKRAHELIKGEPYKAGAYKAVMKSLIRKTTCKDCLEAASCKIPCPDVQIQLKELEMSQPHKLDRLFFDRQGEKKSTYDLAADREAYRKWQEESQ